MPPSRPLYVRVLDHVLRRSFGHPVSVQLLALSSVGLLLSFLLLALAPWLDDGSQQRYLRHLMPSISVEFDSFAVDHLVVFVAISPPVIWLLLVHLAYSQVSSRVEVALLFLRVASCLTVSFALTVLLTEFLSRRAMLALVTLAYASLGLLYSWSVPIWKWYQEEARTKGVIGFLPQSTQELLLQTSLLEWLTDTSFSDKMAPFLPFLLPLTRAEQMSLMEQMPPESQVMMTKPGLLPLLPDSVQKVLLPAEDSDSDQEEGAEDERKMATQERTLAVREQTEAEAEIRAEQRKLLTLTPSTTAGFDFHRPEVLQGAGQDPELLDAEPHGGNVECVASDAVVRVTRQSEGLSYVRAVCRGLGAEFGRVLCDFLAVRMASQRICLSVAPENDAQSSSAMSFLTLPGNSASWNTSTGALLTELKKLSVFKITPLDTSDEASIT
uniref:Uncharacterized protein n=1 Tax=Phytophthora fragariae TaxID=53985 RepID=A0A6A3E3W7_9STRA|nr:hypothetical protein PF009_g22605 [Phytophthora fragariae]